MYADGNMTQKQDTRKAESLPEQLGKTFQRISYALSAELARTNSQQNSPRCPQGQQLTFV